MSFNRFSLLFLMIVGIPAMAEQGCPPGQYPIGGQGVAACAPIPQGSSQETAPAPRPLGKWIKTWGAVAIDGEGAVGVDYGKLSKREAQKGAIANCVKAGGKECRDWATYHNQCAAVAEPYKNGKSVAGKLQFVGNAELEEAKAEAEKKCAAANNNSCRVMYSNCTEQIFEKF
jgi:hypothetical protein